MGWAAGRPAGSSTSAWIKSLGGSEAAPPGPLLPRDIHRRVSDQNPWHGGAAGMTGEPMSLRELLETLKCYGGTLALHNGDTITIEPPDVLTPAPRTALTQHHAPPAALIPPGPSSTSAVDTLLAGRPGVGAPPPAPGPPPHPPA